MSCCGRVKKELRMPIPDNVDIALLEEYMFNPKMDLFSYFCKLYDVTFVKNPKNLQRAIMNMEQLVGAYNNRGLKERVSEIKKEPVEESENKSEVNNQRGKDGRFKKKSS